MAIDEAIKHCLEVAEQNETSAITYKNCKEIKTNMYEKLTAEKAENDCRECAADHRQLAEWLRELKELREENKVLISECDRLIKEKGELLSKVSGAVKAADVQPVKHGRWIWKERHRNSYQIVKGIDECGKEGSLQIHEEYKEQINYCSECGKQGHEIFLNFCPNCGARKDLKDGDAE